MKNKLKIFACLSLLFLLTNCKENNDLFTYDTSKAFIYFDLKYSAINGNITTTKGVDSLEFSFVNVDLVTDEYVLNIPVKISGLAVDYDRSYSISVVDDESTLETQNFKIVKSLIQKGKYTDTLKIEFKKHEELKIKKKRLTVRFEANDNFELGYFNNQKMKIDVSNILMRPTWWNTWQPVFGNYSQEKYQVWVKLYHEKADGTQNYLFNYKNMPGIANASYYPSTFEFIKQLKEYFNKNVMYEGGNPDNPRILIPYQF